MAFVVRWSSDPRHGFNNKRVEVPCGVTESIELACLFFYVVDLSLKVLILLPPNPLAHIIALGLKFTH